MTSTDVALPGWLGPLASALADPGRKGVDAVRPARGARQSAVLVLVGDGSAGPEVLLVERASTLRSHPGQIAFPGGAADPGDVDAADTALREAAEECGIDRTGVVVLGALPPAHVAVSGFDVTAVLAWWRHPAPVTVVDAAEVASAFLVPVAHLVDPARRVTVRHPSGYSGPAFEVAGHLVWGLTAHLLDATLDLAGWSRPWDHDRMVPIPARYLSDGRAARPTSDLGGPDAH